MSSVLRKEYLEVDFTFSQDIFHNIRLFYVQCDRAFIFQVEKELTAALREFSLATAADVHCHACDGGDGDIDDKGDGDG